MSTSSKAQLRAVVFIAFFCPVLAVADDWIATLESLVNSVVGRVFPIIAFYYCGEAFVFWLQNRPDARDKLKSVAIGTVALFAINGIWAWLRSQVR
jgi:hypothetical protein